MKLSTFDNSLKAPSNSNIITKIKIRLNYFPSPIPFILFIFKVIKMHLPEVHRGYKYTVLAIKFHMEM